MANMSYCRFENTDNDLSDCESAIEEMTESETPMREIEKLGDYERQALKRLIDRCKHIAELAEELPEGWRD